MKSLPRALLLYLLLLALPVAALATVFEFVGHPFTTETYTTATVATGGATACKVGNQPTLAAMQVASGAVFYSLHSATATPTALNYAATGGDVLLIHRPDRFRVISQAAGTVNLVVTCFQE